MTKNIGINGPESIRINGMEIGDLPLGQGNEAKEGLAEFLKTDRENQERNIIAKYPSGKLPYLRNSIKVCKANIEKIKGFKAELKIKISEYRSLIDDCRFRDLEMEKHNDDAEAMKALRLKYPPYDIDAMNQQIQQFEEGIARSDEVIEKDYDSIAEVSRVVALVEQRDKELMSIN